jgi:hypothetical protein
MRSRPVVAGRARVTEFTVGGAWRYAYGLRFTDFKVPTSAGPEPAALRSVAPVSAGVNGNKLKRGEAAAVFVAARPPQASRANAR